MLRRRSRVWALSTGLILVIAMLSACGAGTSTTTGTGSSSTSSVITIKIGSEFPTSGGDASSGKPAENGVALAVNEANATNFMPGYKFVMVAKDDTGANGTHDPTVGQKNVTDLVGDAQVAAIVGPLNSSVALAEIPTTNQAPIALISPANTNDCLTQNTPEYECGGAKSKIAALRPTGKVTYFRIATLDQYQGAALANYAYKTKNFRKVFVIDDTEAYGAGLATNFKTFWTKLGGQVVGSQSVKTTSSYENVLTAAASAKPDFIFFGGNDSTGGITIRQQMAKVAGLENMPFELGDGAKTSAMAKAIKPLGGGPVYGSIPGNDASLIPAAKAFSDAYAKQFGAANLGAYAAGAYDCTKIALQAIKAVVDGKKAALPKDSNDDAGAKLFRQAVIDGIQTIQYNGVTGPQAFDKNGDTTDKAVSIYTIGGTAPGPDGWSFIQQVDPTK
jgi:branched-chain amino acid transport system substrate-binding protein